MGAAEQIANFRVERVGVDTVSLAWRPTGDELLWRRLRLGIESGRIAGIWKVTPAGFPGAFVLQDRIAAARWIICPDQELIYAEGRLGAILSGDSGDRSLRPFVELYFADSPLEQAFASVVGRESDLGPRPTVRRLDLAADLRFGDPADGIAALRALEGIAVPRLKMSKWGHEGRTETIAYYTRAKKRKLLLRIYDKGVETGGDRPGALLRFERQHRWARPEQRDAEDLALNGDPEALWLDRFETWAAAAERLVAASGSEPLRSLVEMIELGVVSREKGERLAGAMAVAELRGEGWWRDLGKAHLGRRRRRELAELGLPLVPSSPPASASLGSAIAALREAWAGQASDRDKTARDKGRRQPARGRATARAQGARA